MRDDGDALAWFEGERELARPPPKRDRGVVASALEGGVPVLALGGERDEEAERDPAPRTEADEADEADVDDGGGVGGGTDGARGCETTREGDRDDDDERVEEREDEDDLDGPWGIASSAFVCGSELE